MTIGTRVKHRFTNHTGTIVWGHANLGQRAVRWDGGGAFDCYISELEALA